MGRFAVEDFVSDKLPAASAVTTKAPPLVILDQGWPVGDFLYRWLSLHWKGTLTVGGTLTPSNAGELYAMLQNIVVRTDLHKEIVDNVDGLSMWLMLCAKARQIVGSNLYDSAAAASGGAGTYPFRGSLPIPFLDPSLVRPRDLQIDVLRAQPVVRANFTDAGVFGSSTVSGPQLDTVLRLGANISYDPGPITKEQGADGKIKTDEPIMMPYWFVQPSGLSLTNGQLKRGAQIFLPYGDRVYRRIHIFTRKTGSYSFQAQGMLAQNDTDQIQLKLNNVPLIQPLYQKDLADMMAAKYGYAPLAAPKNQTFSATDRWQGWTPGSNLILDFEDDEKGKNKLSEALSVVSPNRGTLEIDLDITGVTGQDVLVACECALPLPAGAQSARPVKKAAAQPGSTAPTPPQGS